MATRRRLLQHALVVAVAAVAVAGCGSSAGTPAHATPTSTATSSAISGAMGGGAAGGPVPPGFTIVSSTTSRHVTYLLGTAPCTAAPCTSVARYDGARWRGVPAPRVTLAEAGPSTRSNTVRDIRFATPADGWAYGGALWSTHDGAAHWRQVRPGGAVWDLASDGVTTFAVVGRCVGSGCTLRLRSTPAGTDRWTDVPGVAATGSDGHLSVGGGTAVVSLGRGNVFLRRGGTWSRVSGPCASGAPVVVASASSPRIFGLCGDGAAGSTYFTVSYSDDHAASWTTLSVGTRPLRLSNGPFLSVTAASSTLLFAASGSPDLGGTVVVSRDAGRSWATTSGHGGLLSLDGAAGGGWRYVGASGGAHISAVAAVPHHSYWATTDAGRTWRRTTPR